MPDMIARRDNIHARLKKLFSSIRRDPNAASGIFTVGHNEVDLVLFAQLW
jgi:hypothetical protein